MNGASWLQHNCSALPTSHPETPMYNEPAAVGKRQESRMCPPGVWPCSMLVSVATHDSGRGLKVDVRVRSKTQSLSHAMMGTRGLQIDYSFPCSNVCGMSMCPTCRGTVRCLRCYTSSNCSDTTEPSVGSWNYTDALNNCSATQIVAGESHTCALCNRGNVVCWGCNHNGQMDIAAGLKNVMTLRAGPYSTIAITAADPSAPLGATVFVWGSPNPDAPLAYRSALTPPNGAGLPLDNVIAAATGAMAMCVVR